MKERSRYEKICEREAEGSERFGWICDRKLGCGAEVGIRSS